MVQLGWKRKLIKKTDIREKIFGMQVITGACAKDEVELMQENLPNKETETMEVDAPKDKPESMEVDLPPAKLAPCLGSPP